MALTTPILYQIPAFDANNKQIFTFNSVGGDQVIGNRLVIRNNVTNAIVYDQTVEIYAFSHTLPEKILMNHTYYNATIQTMNTKREYSSPSTPIQFWCYVTPTITVLNMPDDNLIPNSEYTFEMQYVQIEGELLQQYQVNLYAIDGRLLSTSGVVYVTSTEPPPYLFKYTFDGFSDGAVYNLEIVGQTVNQTAITTGLLEITVKFEVPNIFALIELKNNMCEGYITIKSNMVSINGTAVPDPPKYIDDDTKIDLREPGSHVIFNEGYKINDDFTIGLWGRDFQNGEVLKMWNMDDTDENPNYLVLRFREEYKANDLTKYAFWDLTVYSGSTISYYIYSPSIIFPNPNDEYAVFIRRINNLYDLTIQYYAPDAPMPTVEEIDALGFTVDMFDKSGFTVDQLDNTPIIRTLKQN